MHAFSENTMEGEQSEVKHIHCANDDIFHAKI